MQILPALLLLVASPLLSAISEVAVSVTNTQAVLHYTAPGAQPCRLAASELPDFSVLLNDVDPSKFPGSDLDSRAGNVSDGQSRSFVLGKRKAERGADLALYSRALQALTHYYYRLTCGAETKTGELTTANLAFGNTYAEPQPVDPDHPGKYLWPTLRMDDRKQKIVDPQTGLLIRRVSLPGDRVITQPNLAQPFQFARSKAWTTPNAALSRESGNAAASIAGNNSDTLLLTPQNNEYAGYISFFRGTRGANKYTLNYFQVILTASTELAACDSNNTDDCKLVACLSIDGVSCYPGSRHFDLALNTRHSRFTLGRADHPIDLWQAPGNPPLNGVEIATRVGKISCDGSTAVEWESGDVFGTHWSKGSTLTIEKQDFTIAEVTDTRHLSLTTACTPGKQKNFAATNFGLLLRKKTASQNKVAIYSASVNYQLGVFPSWDYTGAFDRCSDQTVAGPDGRPGYNCMLPDNGLIYWIDADSAEAHPFARYMGNGTVAASGCGNSDSQIFDSLNPDIWYCGGGVDLRLPQVPYRVRYFGSHLEPTNTLHAGNFEEGENLPACLGAPNPTNAPCLQYSPILTNTGLGTLTSNFDPRFQPDRFRWFYLVGMENGVMIFRVWRSQHNSVGWTVVFDPNAKNNQENSNAGCAGGGQPGCVIATMPSWSGKGIRWCPLKGNDPMSQPGWLSISSFIWGSPGDTAAGVGPYQSDLVENSRLSNVLTACPPNSFGASGNRCTTVKVNGEPRDLSPCTAGVDECGGALETGAPGELQAAEPGDEFTAGPAGGSGEIMRLIQKTGPGQRTWTFERAVGGTLGDWPVGTGAFAFCAANPDPKRQGTANGEVFWNYAADPHGRNTDGKSILGDPYSANGHFFIQRGVKATGYTEDLRCAGADKHFCYQANIFESIPQFVSKPPNGIATQDPAFAGKSAPAYPNQLQQHPSGPGVASSSEDRRYFFDARPFNGSPLSGSVTGDGAQPAKVVAPHLYKFTSAEAPIDRKILPTFAFSGSKPLLDISGPNSRIGVDDVYRYCVAAGAGECLENSVAGDVYVNAPYVTKPFCHHPGQASGFPDEFDLCIGNNAMIYNSVMQIRAEGVDNTGAHQRMLTKALGRNRMLSPFWHSHALANGRTLIIESEYAEGVGDMILSLHVPPPPPDDSIDRTTYASIPLEIKPPAGVAVDNVIVEFGYSEYSTKDRLFCTTRAEECAVAADHVNPADPFFFETTEASKLSGVHCSTGCTVAVPAVSQRVLYLRPVFRDGSMRVIAKGPESVVATQ